MPVNGLNFRAVTGRSRVEPGGESSPRRRRTRHLLLAAIREHAGVTRGELSQLTGLSRSATAEGVQDLLVQHLIAERRTDHGLGRGRPSTLLFPNAPEGFVGAVDFGHSHVFAAVADTRGRILAENGQPADVDQQATDALDAAANLLERCLTDAGLAASDLVGVAAGIPCPLDATTGVVRSPTILAAWVDLDPARELATRVGRPVYVDNDANMGARGEQRFGAARGCRDFIYVKASHGIGAGLVLAGETYRGTLGIAGESATPNYPMAPACVGAVTAAASRRLSRSRRSEGNSRTSIRRETSMPRTRRSPRSPVIHPRHE
jgi:hypothetical protein